MLEEWNAPGEEDGEFTKRWFDNSYFDLFVWFDKEGEIDRFQLCYNKPIDEHAISWVRPSEYYHQRVDDRENRPGKSKATPVLLPDGMFDFRSVAERFAKESKKIDPVVSKFVYSKLADFGAWTSRMIGTFQVQC